MVPKRRCDTELSPLIRGAPNFGENIVDLSKNHPIFYF